MASIAKVEGVGKLLSQLKTLARKGKPTAVIVGYTAEYAIYVHENLAARHVVGQAKFLEQPLREMEGELKSIVVSCLGRGMSLEQSLLVAGMALQRRSQKLVPVDTGNLRGSAFTRAER